MSRWFLVPLLCLAATLTQAAPVRYSLDTARSQVRFVYVFEGRAQEGTMPVAAADIALDLDDLAASRIDVTLNAHAARAGFLFATETMKGPQVLDTAAHPLIRFRATAIRGDLQGATITGDVTIRGVTRPVTLRAELYRQKDTDPRDLNRLTVRLTGSLSRSAFGAGGYPNYVGDRIGLSILARIRR